MSRQRTGKSDRDLLAERTEFDSDAMESLKQYNQIKRDGGSPEVSWSRHGKPTVTDKYALPRKPKA
jgi:hypothetical protein